MAQQEISSDNFTNKAHQFDLAFMPAATAGKLDADQYMAEDLDGAHDSVFGSGNMNFLAMQAAQTNEAMNNTAGLESGNTHESFAVQGQIPSTSAVNAIAGNSADADLARNFVRTAEPSVVSGGSALLLDNTGNSSNNASQGSGNGNPGNDGDSSNGLRGLGGGDGSNGGNGISAQPGRNGSDGADGDPGNGTTIIENHNHTFIDLGDVTQLVDNTVTNITEITNNTVNNLTEIINNITDIDILIKIKTIIYDIIGDPDNPDHDLGVNLDIINGILPVDLPELNLNQVLNPVEDILGDFDIGLNGAIDLLGNNEISNSAGDSDLNILGEGSILDTSLISTDLSIALDVVEQFTGDIDLDLTAAFNLLGSVAPGLIDQFPGGSGGPLGEVGTALNELAAPILQPVLGNTHLDLSGGLNLLDPVAGGEDSNLHLGLNLDLLGANLDPIVLDIPLAPIEAMTDPNLAAVGTALNNFGLTHSIIGDLLGGSQPDTDVALGNHISIADHEVPVPDLAVALNPVEDLLGDFDISNQTTLDLFGSSEVDNSAGDSDIVVTTQIEVVDHVLEQLSLHMPLDPVEHLIGDIDLNLGISDNLFGNVAAPIVDAAPGGSGNGGLLENIGDQISGGIANNFTPEWQQIFTGILETTQQLDTHLNQVTDLLNTTHDNGGFHPLDILNINPQGNETVAWPESVLPQSSDGDVIGNVLGSLPDPVGDVTSGLGGVLDHVTHHSPIIKFGGLFG